MTFLEIARGTYTTGYFYGSKATLLIFGPTKDKKPSGHNRPYQMLP